jgi:carbonic anhydrase
MEKKHLLSLSGEIWDERSTAHRLEEVYVLAEVDWLKRQPNVKKAIQDRGMQIHAFVYDKEEDKSVRLIETVEGGGSDKI